MCFNINYLLLVLQVFQLDSQYVADSGQQSVVDDNKSYVFLLYSPQPASTNTATAVSALSTTAAPTEDSLLIAR